MPKFVWEITARGAWAPQLFHGELPLEMTKPHNVARYVVHELTPHHCEVLDLAAEAMAGSPLDWLAGEFPPPPPFTGKD
jgi:hypothetical protein